ncbi:MAG TPA: hypothetical protein VLY03_13860 [Bacteroidota bacterium]|nr:hypothetical protein [Bacteroidota bacterium]
MKSQDLLVFLGALLVLGLITFGVEAIQSDGPSPGVQVDGKNNPAAQPVVVPVPAEQLPQKKIIKPALGDTTHIIMVENEPRNDGSAGNAAILAEDKLR